MNTHIYKDSTGCTYFETKEESRKILAFFDIKIDDDAFVPQSINDSINFDVTV